jgi:hypothetical protein
VQQNFQFCSVILAIAHDIKRMTVVLDVRDEDMTRDEENGKTAFESTQLSKA